MVRLTAREKWVFTLRANGRALVCQISRYSCSAQEFVEWGSQYHLYDAYQHATYTVMIHTYFLTKC